MPLRAWNIRQSEIGMKSETYRHRLILRGDFDFDQQVIRVDNYPHFHRMGVREDGETFGFIPFQPRKDHVAIRFDHLPTQQRPGYAMNRQSMIIKMQGW